LCREARSDSLYFPFLVTFFLKKKKKKKRRKTV
jgi:hypothetical protein